MYCKTSNTSNMITHLKRKHSVDVNVSTFRTNRIENNRTEVFVIESNLIEAHLNRLSPSVFNPSEKE